MDRYRLYRILFHPTSYGNLALYIGAIILGIIHIILGIYAYTTTPNFPYTSNYAFATTNIGVALY